MAARSDAGPPIEIRGHFMNPSLEAFVKFYLRVVLGTLMLVAFIAFVSLPFILGRPVGHAQDATQAADRHMT